MNDPVQVARSLEEIARLIALSGESPFKARAFERGAALISAIVGQLQAVIEERELEHIEGIGPSLSKQIRELWDTGSSSLLQRLRSEFPLGAGELSQLSGMSARRIRLLHDQLGISSLEALREACASGLVRGLKGFGQKTEAQLLRQIEALEAHQTGERRMLLAEADELLAEIARHLVESGVAQAAQATGAARRADETLLELALLVVADDAEPVFAALKPLSKIVYVDAKRSSAYLTTGVPLRLHIAPRARAALSWLRSTGTEAHLEQLSARASSLGRALAPRPSDGSETLAAAEAALYHDLSLHYVPAELRHGQGEVAAAERDDFADLLRLEDVRGMVHCHTTYSDGKHSVEEMARAAHALGMDYITITDHSPTAHYARGVEIDRLRQQWDEIREVEARVPIRILRGTEADILADGSLDYPDSVLDGLEVVIASIHSRYQMGRAAMTERLVRAMQLPVFKIWGHALGRLLLQREPIDCDLERVFEALSQARGAIEISGDRHRLDLPPGLIPAARARGLRFVVSVDAHSTAGLGALGLGVKIARRGGVRRGEVLNALPTAAFVAAVRPT